MSLFLQTLVLRSILFREQDSEQSIAERCDDAVGLQDLQEEANEIEIIRGQDFYQNGQ